MDNPFERWAKRVWERLVAEPVTDPGEGDALLDAIVRMTHLDATGGEGGSDPIIWGILGQQMSCPPQPVRHDPPGHDDPGKAAADQATGAIRGTPNGTSSP